MVLENKHLLPIHPLSQDTVKSKSEFPSPSITNFTLSWHSVDPEGKSWVTGSGWSSNKPDGISICDRPGGFEAVHLLLRIKFKMNWQSCQMGSTEMLQQVIKLLQGRSCSEFPSLEFVCTQMNLNVNRRMQSGVWPGHCLRHALELKSEICLALAEVLGMCLLWNWMTFLTSSGTMMFCQQNSAWCWILVHLWLRDLCIPYKSNHWDCHSFIDCVINKTLWCVLL